MKDQIIIGDAYKSLKKIPADSIDCVITSPPYFGLRDYGVKGQLGLEKTPQEFVAGMVKVFHEIKRVLKPTGTLWLNIGDSYASFRDSKSTPDSLRGKNAGTKVPVSNNRNPANLRTAGLKHKDMCGVPWRLAFALQADGWYLRQDIIWHKPNPMPESVGDRCTKSHEYVFLLSKSPIYFYDQKAIREPLTETSIARLSQPNIENQMGSDRVPGKTNGRMKAVAKGWHDHENDLVVGNRIGMKMNHPDGANKRSVWTIPTMPFKDAHFATFPEKLIEPMVLAGCPENGVVLDPFFGAGTTGVVAFKLNRRYVGIELNKKYVVIAKKRLSGLTMPIPW